MADSLVKFDDDAKSATSKIWQDVRRMLDLEFPEAALVSEWGCPPLSIKAGFHADFLLDHGNSGYRSLVRGHLDGGESYFKKDAKTGIERFLAQYLPWYEATKNDGYMAVITGNHDTPRISAGLSQRELALAYAFIFTMPGVPFLYYGDEIGMRYLSGLPTKEGGYSRTGSRTPMQWNKDGSGFSDAHPEDFYLPVDSDPGAPDVEEQEGDPLSLLNTVRSLIRLRQSEKDLGAKANLEVVHAPAPGCGDRSFVYRRCSCIVAVNPGGEGVSVTVPAPGKPEALYSIGDCGFENGECRLGPQSFGVWK